MPRRITPTLAAVLSLAGCDGPSAPSQTTHAPNAEVDAPKSGLLTDLGARRQWRATAVKIPLARPNVTVTIATADASTAIIHAWGGNQNDYNTPMMRMNNGPVLYAITPEEFERLRRDRSRAP